MIQDWLAWTLGGTLGRVAGSMATAAGAEALIPHRLHALNTRDIHQKAWIKNAGVCGGGGLCGDAKLVRGLQRSNIVDECTKDHDFAKACDPKDAKPAQTRLPLRHWTTHASWSAWPQESVLHSSGAMGSLQLASLVQELQRECVGGALAVRRVSTPPLSMMDLATLVGGGCLASNLASIWAHWDCTITFHQAPSKEGAPPCPPLVRPTTPTLTIFAALLGVGLTIATNAKQAFPCTTRQNDVFLPYRVPHDDGRSQRFDASWIRLPVAPKSLPHHVVFELRVLLEGQTREGFQQEAPMGTTPRRRRSPRWIQEGSQGCTLSMVPERFLIHVGKLSRSRSQ